MTRPIRLHWLDPHKPDEPFPPVDTAMAEPNGLLAIGGDLSATRLVRAYSDGIFPWFNPDEPILWWSPDPRVLFFPDQIHRSRSLQKVLRQNQFAITFDQAFEQVITACAEPRGQQQGTWLGPEMRQAYNELHRLGYAHSVEVWMEGELTGGLYGIAIGRGFFGESMFSTTANASKLALSCLGQQLEDWNYLFLDGQVGSDHLYSLGAVNMSRSAFSRLLKDAVSGSAAPHSWRYSGEIGNNSVHLPPQLRNPSR